MSVKRIIEIEKPDSLLSTLGGQTGLTLSMQLDKEGFLAEHNVRLLGANRSTPSTRRRTARCSRTPWRRSVSPVSPPRWWKICRMPSTSPRRSAYPVIVRPAFTMGGTGGGIATTMEELAGDR